ncbi:hypothetical protein BJ875DRAFT_539939 [Amylocarpus encephaloides]|uniref:Uncharacterized protein n=1 Tax=Amylocarpus encephaloides TaxID=45428 RepID=A0A9P8C947_9HELO|nr:hypothetical protein BJ875DRAFT_539939 [Amylocarpus encephaloides]
MDSDTYRHITPPASARLASDRATELPYYNTHTEAPPPYVPSHYDVPIQGKRRVIPIRNKRERKKAYFCIIISIIALVVLPTVIFGVVISQVNKAPGYRQEQGCSSRTSTGMTESTVDDSTKCKE